MITNSLIRNRPSSYLRLLISDLSFGFINWLLLTSLFRLWGIKLTWNDCTRSSLSLRSYHTHWAHSCASGQCKTIGNECMRMQVIFTSGIFFVYHCIDSWSVRNSVNPIFRQFGPTVKNCTLLKHTHFVRWAYIIVVHKVR